MKKEYVAPDLYFESFELSESVAAGCDTEMTNSVITVGYFLDSLNMSCKMEYDENSGVIEGYCYWNGSLKFFLS